jgi:hypothetical protein
MSVWKSIFDELPADGEQVWARVWNVYGELAIVTYDATNQEFTVDATGVIIPTYQISRWKEYLPPPTSTLLLDVYPGAAMAYSVFQLKESAQYSMQVCRDSDSAVLDIGFNAGYIDIAAINSFKGSSTVYVTIFYDQSGNNLHMTQPVFTLAPYIVLAGVNQLVNGILSLNFNGSTRYMNSPNKTIAQPLTYFNVSKLFNAFGAGTSYVCFGSSVNANRCLLYKTTSNKWGIFAGTELPTVANADANQHLFTCLFNGVSSELRIDNALAVSGNAGAQTFGASPTMGRQTTGNNWNSDIQEHIIYPSNKSTDFAAIETEINSRFSIY